MGHLIRIANQLVQLCSTTSLGDFLRKNLPETADVLEKFKTSTLQEVNATQEMLLVSTANLTFKMTVKFPSKIKWLTINSTH